MAGFFGLASKFSKWMVGWFGTEVVGEVGKANCPKKNKNMHFKTMLQAAGKNTSVRLNYVVSNSLKLFIPHKLSHGQFKTL